VPGAAGDGQAGKDSKAAPDVVTVAADGARRTRPHDDNAEEKDSEHAERKEKEFADDGSEDKDSKHNDYERDEERSTVNLGVQGTAEMPLESQNGKALAMISRVESKLKGKDFMAELGGQAGQDSVLSDLYSSVSVAGVLDVPAQVQKLVLEATSHLNLCQSYIGWCPFW